MIKAVDLFAGLGGWSTGARMAGVGVLWTTNPWALVVEFKRIQPEPHNTLPGLRRAGDFCL